MTQDERRDRRRQMAADCGKSWDVAAVAQKHGVTLKTVGDACAEFGVASPPRMHVSTYAIIAALMTGECGNRIAGRFRISHQRVSKIKIEAVAAGIPLPK